MKSRRDFLQEITAAGIALAVSPGNRLAAESETACSPSGEQSLAGSWRFRLDPNDEGVSQNWFNSILPDSISLPGSCEQAGYGIKTTVRETDRLTRSFIYEGAAWYQQTISIPPDWAGKRVELFLERCYWISGVWVDGSAYGEQTGLSAAHLHDLGRLMPGDHTLTLRVDNRYAFPIGRWGFSITEDTQGNWNGIIGRIALRATDLIWIRNAQVYAGHLLVDMGNATGNPQPAILSRQSVSIPVNGGQVKIPFAAGKPDWDEFFPRLHELTLTLEAGHYRDTKTIHYGLSGLTTAKGQFILNGRPVMMRGPVNECIYPLTGYPPMDKDSWLRLLRIIQSYGFNFMRFNSWCPPDAAFQAADELGVFLQIEIPFWSAGAPEYGRDKARDQFLLEELYRILDAYGNHPSFAFMAMGNESGGPMNILVRKGREHDLRRLYRCQDGDVKANGDYAEMGTAIGQRGIAGPRTDWDRWSLIRDPEVIKYKTQDLPVLAHEVGQWSGYPDFDQLSKFTGTQKPYNYERFRDSLAAHHMADQAKAFARAAGQFSLSLYKDEIEGCLRSYPHGGFQIVEARDFPGEGCAIIGWLDAFWDSKGLIEPEAFRAFCGPTVCLLRMPKRIYVAGEDFIAEAALAHYGPDNLDLQPKWEISDAAGKIVFSGLWPRKKITTGRLQELGRIAVKLTGFSGAQQLRVSLRAGKYVNAWSIWVYPESNGRPSPSGIRISYAFDADTREALRAGASVVLFSAPGQGLFEIKNQMLGPDEIRQFPPVAKGKNAIPGSFMPAFWNLRLFNQIGTLSILCDPAHPALAQFPTGERSDWQWADLLGRFTAEDSYRIAGDDRNHDWGDVSNRSKCIILNETPPDYRPIVQMIDNYERNYKLGLIFECGFGDGKLLVCALDLDTDAGSRPAARQLKMSLLNYAASPSFRPTHALPGDLLEKILT